MTAGLVSVIMPCYNDGLHIEEAINSVLEQTYSQHEIIIVNDGSTCEATLQKLLEVEERYNIQLIHQLNAGPSAARNKGITRARGEFILPLDADDVILPAYMEKAIEVFSRDKKTGIVYCKASLFGLVEELWELPEYSAQEMIWGNVIFNSAFFKKSLWTEFGGYDEELIHGNEDYDLWLRFIKNNVGVSQIPERLFKYRIKPSSRTSKLLTLSNDALIGTSEKIYENHKDFLLSDIEYLVRRRLSLEIEAVACSRSEASLTS